MEQVSFRYHEKFWSYDFFFIFFFNATLYRSALFNVSELLREDQQEGKAACAVAPVIDSGGSKKNNKSLQNNKLFGIIWKSNHLMFQLMIVASLVIVNCYYVSYPKLARNRFSRIKYFSLTFFLYINYFNWTNMHKLFNWKKKLLPIFLKPLDPLYNCVII